MTIKGNRVFLTSDEAIDLLPDGDIIHTFRNPGGFMLIGADWDRDDIVTALAEGCEVGGGMCRRMGHALTVGGLFIAHDEARMAALVPDEAAP